MTTSDRDLVREVAEVLRVPKAEPADSFVLRNHGRNAMLPRSYPERAFSTRYAQKDLEYALALAAQAGVEATGARLMRERFERAIAAGDGDRYWPVIAEHVEREDAR